METLMLLSGIGLLLGGAMFTWVTVGNRRAGKAWRGSALLSGATLLYAGVALSGIFSPATTLGTVLVVVVAVLMWAGVFVAWRERRQADTGIQG